MAEQQRTLEERAARVTAAANECCYRPGDYCGRVGQLALEEMREVVAVEREACARVADLKIREFENLPHYCNAATGAASIANAIRARGQ